MWICGVAHPNVKRITAIERIKEELKQIISDGTTPEYDVLQRFCCGILEEEMFEQREKIELLVSIINGRLPRDEKVRLRGYLDDCQSFFFMTKDELERVVLEDHPDIVRELVAEAKKEVQKNPASTLSEKAFFARFGLKKNEKRVLQNPQLPKTFLERINSVIGSHVVSSGVFYKGFSGAGTASGAIVSLSSQLMAQIPRVFGVAADSWAGNMCLYGGLRGVSTLLRVITSLPLAVDYLVGEVERRANSYGLSWIDLEEIASKLPEVGLRWAVPLQEMIIGGVEGVKGRFDSWVQEIEHLRQLKEKRSSLGQTSHALFKERSRLDDFTGELKQGCQRFVQDGATGVDVSTCQKVAQMSGVEIERVF